MKPRFVGIDALILVPCPAESYKDLKQTGVRNPVFLLDEIDKVGQDFARATRPPHFWKR